MAPIARIALSTIKSTFQPSRNTLQCALGRQSSIAYLTATRNYATAFSRDKPHVNIGPILPHLFLISYKTNLINQEPLATSIMEKPPSQPQSLNDKPTKVSLPF